jgi:hypothetical protein
MMCNRKGVLKKAEARKTEGIVFYQFEFENPLDLALPRPGPKDKKYVCFLRENCLMYESISC